MIVMYIMFVSIVRHAKLHTLHGEFQLSGLISEFTLLTIAATVFEPESFIF